MPDLALFPERYHGVKTVTFHAGFASTFGHLFVWSAAQFVRAGLIASMTPLVKPLHVISQWMERFVSDKGGMFVSLEGLGTDGKLLKLDWHLVAAKNHGPYTTKGLPLRGECCMPVRARR